MKLALSIVAGPLLALTLAAPPPAKEWRGIKPLRSTRADVERLLGPPESESGSVYVTENERVSVTYSHRACDHGWQVPPDTVISFFVHPKKPPKLSDLKLDEKRYERRRDLHVETLYYYIDPQEGINYTTDSAVGAVTAIEYYPSLKDKALLCQPPAAGKAGDAEGPPSPAATPKPAGRPDANSRGRRRRPRRRP